MVSRIDFGAAMRMTGNQAGQTFEPPKISELPGIVQRKLSIALPGSDARAVLKIRRDQISGALSGNVERGFQPIIGKVMSIPNL